MRAVVWHGGSDLRLESVPSPLETNGQVVVDVLLAGICGSDLHPIRGHAGPRRPPLILGHEVIGTIHGDRRRYAIFPLATCGDCAACRRGEENLCASRGLLGLDRPGAFAEQVAVPRSSLVPVPDDLEDRLAVLVEPLATSVSALRAEQLEEAARICVVGCGPIGLLAIHAARHYGHDVVAVEPIASRRALARSFGAREAYPGLAAIENRDLDVVIDAVGIDATARRGLAALRRGGTVIVLGLGGEDAVVPLAQMVRGGLRLRGHYAYTAADFEAALNMLADDRPPTDWLTLVDLAGVAAGIDDLIQRPEVATKVLVRVGRDGSTLHATTDTMPHAATASPGSR